MTDNNLIECIYNSSIKILMPLSILEKFRLLNNLNADLPDSKFYANIPLIKDALGKPIDFTEYEFTLFFQLSNMEYHDFLNNIKNANTNTNADINANTNADNNKDELIRKFLILVNFLDNETYLESLMSYSRLLILDSGMLTCEIH